MSGDTHGWTERLAAQFMYNWDLWIAGEPLLNPVDVAKGYSAR